jgi:hypothetical protein
MCDRDTHTEYGDHISLIYENRLKQGAGRVPRRGLCEEFAIQLSLTKQLMVRQRNNSSSPPLMLLPQHVSVIRPSSGGNLSLKM